MRVPRYVPESPELLADREWEEYTRWQSTREANAEKSDLIKDRCVLTGLMSFDVAGPECIRIGVPESFSHAYDAEVAA